MATVCTGVAIVVPATAPVLAATPVASTLLVTSFHGAISTIDTGTDTVVAGPASLGGAHQPWSVAVVPNGETAYVTGLGSNNVTPVHVATLATGTNLCLPNGSCPSSVAAQPEAIAVTPDGSAAYVANSGLDQLSVILVAQNKVANTPIQLPSGSSPSAIAITPDGRTAYVAAYARGEVLPVSIPSGQVGTPIRVGDGPTGLAITPDGRHLYVANSGAGSSGSVSHVRLAVSPVSVTTFNPQPNEPNAIAPHAIAISPAGDVAYVTDVNTSRVVPINLATDVPGQGVFVGAYPVAIAVSPDAQAVYVGNQLDDTVAVLRVAGTSLSLSATIPVASPTAIAFVPRQAPIAAFTTSLAPAGSPTSFDASGSRTVPAGGALSYQWDFGDGTTAGPLSETTTTHVYPTAGSYTVTLTVADGTGTSTGQVFTGQTLSRNGGPGARASAVVVVQQPTAGAGPVAFVANSEAGQATPLGLTPATPAAAAGSPIPTGNGPSSVAITPDGRTAYVTNRASNSVSPINVATAQAGAPIAVGTTPEAVAVTPDGSAAYVVSSGEGSVRRITTATGAVGGPIGVGNAPSAIAIHPGGSRAFVANAADNTVTPLDLGSGTAGNPVSATGLTNPVAIAVHPGGTVAYVVSSATPTSAGGITSFDLSGPTPVPAQTLTIGAAGARPNAVAVTPAGNAAYVTTAAGALAQVSLNGLEMTLRSFTPVAQALFGIAVTPDGTAAYLTANAAGGGGTVPAVVPVKLGSPLQVGAATPVAGGPRGIAITPDQAPIALLTASPNGATAAPATVAFDASGSSNPSSAIVEYAWDFGDGATAVTSAPTTEHTYTVGGAFDARVTLTDAAGTSTRQVFTGQTVSRNGGPAATSTRQVVVVPTVTGLSPATGSAGASVTVTGTGFSTAAGATTVAFGAAPATAVECSSTTKCTATAPAGSGTVHVRVTVGGQTSAENQSVGQFSYGGSTSTTTPAPTTTVPPPSGGGGGFLGLIRFLQSLLGR
jgi:YVTN family beta-propeller protein